MDEVASRTPWVRLTLDEGADGFVGYEDSAGRTVRPPTAPWGRVTGWDYLPTPINLWWAARSSHALFAAAARLPVIREGPYGGHQVPLAVLVQLPPGTPWPSVWEDRMRHLLRTVGLADQRYTLAAAVPEFSLAAFDLPFNIGVVGPDAGPLTAALPSLLGSVSPTDLEYGIRIRPLGPFPPGPLTPDLDILVAPSTSLPEVAGSGRTGPRLIILANPMGAAESLTVDEVPAGSSLLAFPPGTSATAADLARQVLWALTHDWPLHEAVLVACRRAGLSNTQQAGLRLMTSAGALDGFRLLGPFEQMRGRAREVIRYRRTAVERPSPPGTDSPIEQAVHWAGEAVAEFHRESDGFSELVRANAALDRARPSMEALVRGVAGLTPAQRSELEENQGRKVAIWVEHDPMTMGRYRASALHHGSVLGRGQRYLVNVGVGIDWPTDLVSPDTPALDPILPPVDGKDGHELTVTVFSATTKVLDQPSKSLWLGRLGPSLPVLFLVETPRRRRTTQLRVVLYHRGHILQSFQLTARLASEEGDVSGGLAVEQEFSRRERLSDLDGLPERQLSVVTNDDAEGAHALMFESGDRLVLDDDTARHVRSGRATGRPWKTSGRCSAGSRRWLKFPSQAS